MAHVHRALRCLRNKRQLLLFRYRHPLPRHLRRITSHRVSYVADISACSYWREAASPVGRRLRASSVRVCYTALKRRAARDSPVQYQRQTQAMSLDRIAKRTCLLQFLFTTASISYTQNPWRMVEESGYVRLGHSCPRPPFGVLPPRAWSISDESFSLDCLIRELGGSG